MADFDYYGADYGAEDPSRFMEAVRSFGIANWVGALTSLGLVAGLGSWAVDLTFRDVSTVPVIMALDGPMRVEPTDPGGTVAPYQGLALADITSGGAAAPAPDQIVLAPPPVTLDAPAQSDRIAALAAAADAPEIDEVTALDDGVVTVAHAEDAEMAPPADDLVADVSASDTGEDAVLIAGAVEDSADDAIDLASDNPFSAAIAAALGDAVGSAEPGLVESVRPRARPAHLHRVAASTPIEAPVQPAGIEVASATQAIRTATDAGPGTVREVDPSSLAAGTRIVQLGAFNSPAVARAEWDRLNQRFGAYMAGKSRMVEVASSGGRDFWRLRAVGFGDGADARRFCSELEAKGATCIPVTVR